MLASTPHGPAAWGSAAWRDSAVAWLDESLARAGRRRSGPVEQPRTRPWATVLRAPTTSGPVWLKATTPATSAEVALYPLLVRSAAPRVLAPLAVDVERGWLLLPDGGRTLADDGPGAALVGGLTGALVALAEVQTALAPHVEELLAVGVPDMRPEVMPARFAEALEVTRRDVTPGDAGGADALAEVRRLPPAVARWCAVLQGSALGATLDHGDLNPPNVLTGGPGAPRFYDWGDAVVAHPLAGARLPLQQLRDALPGGDHDPALLAARDRYLRAVVPQDDPDDPDPEGLVDVLEAACRLGTVARVLTWERGLRAAREAGEEVRPDLVASAGQVLASVLDVSPYGSG